MNGHSVIASSAGNFSDRLGYARMSGTHHPGEIRGVNPSSSFVILANCITLSNSYFRSSLRRIAAEGLSFSSRTTLHKKPAFTKIRGGLFAAINAISARSDLSSRDSPFTENGFGFRGFIFYRWWG